MKETIRQGNLCFIEEETLSDGSAVYNVIVFEEILDDIFGKASNDVIKSHLGRGEITDRVVLYPVNKEKADILFDTIEKLG